MSEFAQSWNLSRKRFLDALEGASQEQLNWRLHPGTLTLGEMGLHVAGVEVLFSSQLLDLPLDPFAQKLKSAATDGVVNDKPFPFSPDEITPEAVAMGLQVSGSMAGPMLESPTEAARHKEIVSALGPIIDGNGAMARLGFHAAYHQGQAHLLRTSPGFPTT